MEELSARYADARQDRLDGISIDYDDWHFNVRPSNTEPLLRLCLESLRSREDMERRRDEVLSVIRS
jgi:phosphomannomutase